MVRVRDGEATSHLLRIPVSWLADDTKGLACESDVTLVRLPLAPENHINVATVGEFQRDGLLQSTRPSYLCLTLPSLLQTQNFADPSAQESEIIQSRLGLSLPDHLASDSTIRLGPSHDIVMHRLSRFSPFKKAREQSNGTSGDSPGDSGSSETNRAMTNGTDSHGPAHSRTNGVTPMSNIDVSVLIKPLPPTSIDP